MSASPPMTNEEIDAYNDEIDAMEARVRERERIAEEKHANCLLRKLVMPEDVFVQGQRGYTQGELEGFKKSSAAFVDDPEERKRRWEDGLARARWTVCQPPKRRREEWLSTYRSRCEAQQAEVDMRNAAALRQVPGTPEDIGRDLSVPRGGL